MQLVVIFINMNNIFKQIPLNAILYYICLLFINYEQFN